MTSSRMFNFSDNKSTLVRDYFPPIVLDDDGEYVMGLFNLQTYNSVPNINASNNLFHYRYGMDHEDFVVVIPNGSYEVSDLSRFITKHMNKRNEFLISLPDAAKDVILARVDDDDTSKIAIVKDSSKKITYEDFTFQLNVNSNTLKCEIESSVYIDFRDTNSLGKVLGFNQKLLEPYKKHISDNSINISGVNTIYVHCNITTGSYIDDTQGHAIYQFSLNVPPGYKILEHPSNVIYLPINCRTISNITLKICDPTGGTIDFRGEEINIGLHLKKVFR